MQAVFLFGPPGSGKTTLGRAAEHTGRAAYFSGGEAVRARPKAAFDGLVKPRHQLFVAAAAAARDMAAAARRAGKQLLIVDAASPNSASCWYITHLLAQVGVDIVGAVQIVGLDDSELVARLTQRARDANETAASAEQRLAEYKVQPEVRSLLSLGANRGRVADLAAKAPGGGGAKPAADLAAELLDFFGRLPSPPSPLSIPPPAAPPGLVAVPDVARYVQVLDVLLTCGAVDGGSHVSGSFEIVGSREAAGGSAVCHQLRNPAARKAEPGVPTVDTHVVSLKIDGVRYALVASCDGYFFVPRHNDVVFTIGPGVHVEGNSVVDKRMRLNPKTVIVADGELVEIPRRGPAAGAAAQHLFVVLDVLHDSGKQSRRRLLYSESLITRVEAAALTFPLEPSFGVEVAADSRELDPYYHKNHGGFPSEAPPPAATGAAISFCRKRYFSLLHLPKLLAVDAENERARRAQGPGAAPPVFYPTDGLIFTPKRFYLKGSDGTLIKWKSPDHMTSDFLLTTAPRDPSQGAAGGVTAVLWALRAKPFCYVHFDSIDNLTPEEAERWNGRIVECSCRFVKECRTQLEGEAAEEEEEDEESRRVWTIERVRADKARPNDERVAGACLNRALRVPADALMSLLPNVADSGNTIRFGGRESRCKSCGTRIHANTTRFESTTEADGENAPAGKQPAGEPHDGSKFRGVSTCLDCMESETSRAVSSLRPTVIPVDTRGMTEAEKQYHDNSAAPTEREYWNRFNNWIKTILLRRHRRAGAVVLDLGCGKGGDLGKLTVDTSLYVGVDPVASRIEAARKRYQGLNSPYRCVLGVGRMEDPELLRKVERAKPCCRGVAFDVVSCQLALHYCWSDRTAASNLVRNAGTRLRTGGHFIGVIPDYDLLTTRVRDSSCGGAEPVPLNIGPAVLTFPPETASAIRAFPDPATPPSESWFGLKYHFQLKTYVKGDEYLVSPASLEQLCAEHGMSPVREESVNALQYRQFAANAADSKDIAASCAAKMRLDFDSTEDEDNREMMGLYRTFVFVKDPDSSAGDLELFKAPTPFHDDYRVVHDFR